MCSQLGLSGGEAYGGGEFGFGRSDQPIWLDHVQCTGSEDFLSDCPHSTEWGNTTCNHREDVGVVCKGEVKVHVIVSHFMCI